VTPALSLLPHIIVKVSSPASMARNNRPLMKFVRKVDAASKTQYLTSVWILQRLQIESRPGGKNPVLSLFHFLILEDTVDTAEVLKAAESLQKPYCNWIIICVPIRYSMHL
jgi:hypothetical protein